MRGATPCSTLLRALHAHCASTGLRRWIFRPAHPLTPPAFPSFPFFRPLPSAHADYTMQARALTNARRFATGKDLRFGASARAMMLQGVDQ